LIKLMELVNIFYIILLASASGLCIALIIYLYRITRSISKIEIDIKDLTNQIKPLIASTTNLSEKLNFISDEAKQPIIIVKEVIEDIKDRIDVILDFEEKLRKGVEGPLTKLLNTLSGVSNGVNAFWDSYKRR
jgi:uncharacterized protein YoxC